MDRFTVKEAAPYIGASEHKVRKMVHLKEIPSYKIGNRIMFRKSTLDEWIAKQEEEGFKGTGGNQ